MKTVFVDANLFLRFFTRDDDQQFARASNVFRQAAESQVLLVAGPPVLFEVAWTLRAAYRVSREKVLDVLSRIAALSGLRLVDVALVEAALRIAQASGQEFADAYVVASAAAEQADEIATFNLKHFEKMGFPLRVL